MICAPPEQINMDMVDLSIPTQDIYQHSSMVEQWPLQPTVPGSSPGVGGHQFLINE